MSTWQRSILRRQFIKKDEPFYPVPCSATRSLSPLVSLCFCCQYTYVGSCFERRFTGCLSLFWAQPFRVLPRSGIAGVHTRLDVDGACSVGSWMLGLFNGARTDGSRAANGSDRVFTGGSWVWKRA